MCGRYRLKDPKAAFDWLEVAPAHDFKPRFNIAPAQSVPVLAALHKIEPMTWGILPRWAKDTAKACINARSETIREKRSFKSAVTQRRCLVPADGFYEWDRRDKQPYLFTVKNGAPFAIAAIWESAADANRCCLLTTAANSLLQPIHDRMPVIIHRDDWDEWFSPGDLADLPFNRITASYSAVEMSALAVTRLVNTAAIDDPRCSEPANPSPSAEPRRLKIARKSDQTTFDF